MKVVKMLCMCVASCISIDGNDHDGRYVIPSLWIVRLLFIIPNCTAYIYHISIISHTHSLNHSII